MIELERHLAKHADRVQRLAQRLVREEARDCLARLGGLRRRRVDRLECIVDRAPISGELGVSLVPVAAKRVHQLVIQLPSIAVFVSVAVFASAATAATHAMLHRIEVRQVVLQHLVQVVLVEVVRLVRAERDLAHARRVRLAVVRVVQERAHRARRGCRGEEAAIAAVLGRHAEKRDLQDSHLVQHARLRAVRGERVAVLARGNRTGPRVAHEEFRGAVVPESRCSPRS